MTLRAHDGVTIPKGVLHKPRAAGAPWCFDGRACRRGADRLTNRSGRAGSSSHAVRPARVGHRPLVLVSSRIPSSPAKVPAAARMSAHGIATPRRRSTPREPSSVSRSSAVASGRCRSPRGSGRSAERDRLEICPERKSASRRSQFSNTTRARTWCSRTSPCRRGSRRTWLSPISPSVHAQAREPRAAKIFDAPASTRPAPPRSPSCSAASRSRSGTDSCQPWPRSGPSRRIAPPPKAERCERRCPAAPYRRSTRPPLSSPSAASSASRSRESRCSGRSGACTSPQYPCPQDQSILLPRGMRTRDPARHTARSRTNPPAGLHTQTNKGVLSGPGRPQGAAEGPAFTSDTRPAVGTRRCVVSSSRRETASTSSTCRRPSRLLEQAQELRLRTWRGSGRHRPLRGHQEAGPRHDRGGRGRRRHAVCQGAPWLGGPLTNFQTILQADRATASKAQRTGQRERCIARASPISARSG